MTEANDTVQEAVEELRGPTYEDLEARAGGTAGTKLREINESRARYHEFLDELENEDRYSEEYKQQMAWERYNQTVELARTAGPEARAEFEKRAKTAERMSIPMPENEAVYTTSETKTMLTQNEHSRIRAMVERSGEVGKDTPFAAKPYELLRQEFDHGMEIGGPHGGAICRAVVEVVRENEGGVGMVVDAHRNERHLRALEDAEMERTLLDMVVTEHIKEPPYPRPGQAKRDMREIGTYSRRGGNPFLKKGSEPILARNTSKGGKRRPGWRS